MGLKSQLAAAGQSASYIRDKAVVLLFLSGGASHIETFDPKMSAPDGVRSITGEVKTSLPGVTFGGSFPLMARLANRMAIVRSFQHSVGDHERAIRHVLSGGTTGDGKQPGGFSMGSATPASRNQPSGDWHADLWPAGK